MTVSCANAENARLHRTALRTSCVIGSPSVEKIRPDESSMRNESPVTRCALGAPIYGCVTLWIVLRRLKLSVRSVADRASPFEELKRAKIIYWELYYSVPHPSRGCVTYMTLGGGAP